jgi:hypothetical protein
MDLEDSIRADDLVMHVGHHYEHGSICLIHGTGDYVVMICEDQDIFKNKAA